MDEERKVVSVLEIKDNSVLEKNIINVLDMINNMLKHYDEIDLSKTNCSIKSIKRTPLISEMDNELSDGIAILPEPSKRDYKIHLEKRED